MAKGSYSVGNNEQPPRKDTSFRSFICSLLIFLALCLIILLATIKWGNSNTDESHQRAEMNVKEDIEIFNDKDKNTTARFVVVSIPEIITNPTIKTTTVFAEKERVDAETTRGTTTTTTTTTENPPTISKIDATVRGVTAIFQLFTGATEKTIATTILKQSTETTNKPSSSVTRNWIVPLTGNGATTEKGAATTILKQSTETTNKPSSSVTRNWIVPLTGNGATTKKSVATTISEQSTETTDNPSSSVTRNWMVPLTGSGATTEKAVATTISEQSAETSSIPRKFAFTFTGTGGTTESNVATALLKKFSEVFSTTETTEFSISVTKNSTTPSAYSPKNPAILVTSTSDEEDSTFSTETPLKVSSSTTEYAFSTLTTSTTKTTPISVVTTEKEYSTSPTTEAFLAGSYLTTEDNFTNFSALTTENYNFTSTSSSTASTTSTTATLTSSASTKTTPQNLVAPKSDICTTSICNQTTSKILSSIKHSVGPCEDFYEFACGGGASPISDNIEESLNSELLSYLINNDNSSDRFNQNFNKFYKSCVQYEDFFRYNERIKNVKELIEEVGQFDDQINTQQSFNITQLFAHLLLRQSLPFFDFALHIDENSVFALQLTIPERGSFKSSLKDWSHLYWHQQYCLRKENLKMFTDYLDLNGIYESLKKCRRDYSHYLNSIEETIRQLEIFSHLNSTQLLKEIKDIRFTIEFDILNLIDKFPAPAEIEMAYVNKDYVYTAMNDLQKHSQIIDWIALLKTVTGYDFKPSDPIQVYFWTEFQQILDALTSVDPRNLNNALLAIYANNLYQHTVIPRSTTNRDLYCLDLSKQLLPDVAFFTIQTLFVEKIVGGQRLIGNLFDLLKQQFQASLFERDWLDENSTEILMEQFEKIHIEDFPENLDKQLINDNHQQLTIDDDNYQKNLIKLIENRKRTVWKLAKNPASSQLIYLNFLDTLSMEPLTIQENGSIVVPFGLLYRCQSNLPSYLSLSNIGLHLSRAIVRNFDNYMMRRSLSDNAIKYYNYLLYHTEDQVMYFSPRMFEHRNVTFNFNGSLSANERIIDNAALRLIQDTLTNSSLLNDKLLPWISDSYPPDKIIFITAAQEYCERSTVLDFMLKIFESHNLPAPLKIQNIASNSESFTEKFECPDGAGMNLSEEKLQFPYLVYQEESYSTLYGN